MNALSYVVFSVGGQDPIIDSLVSSVAAPEAGTSYTLSWQSRSASSVTISPIGNVALSGSTARVAGAANSTTTYQMTVIGLNGRSISTSLSVSAAASITQCECNEFLWSNSTRCGFGSSGTGWLNGPPPDNCTLPGIQV